MKLWQKNQSQERNIQWKTRDFYNSNIDGPKKIVSIPIVKMSKHQRKETILKSLWEKHQVIENGESTRIIFNYLVVTLAARKVWNHVLQFLKANKY